MATEVVSSSQHLADSLSTLDPGKHWIVGGAIFKPDGASKVPAQPLELLMVKRAQQEPAFPNFWEIPGGGVEESDESIKVAVTREVFEETGLVTSEVLAGIELQTWKGRIKTFARLAYVLGVEPGEVKLNPEEHAEYKWMRHEQIEGLQMTTQMRKTIDDAFAVGAQLARKGASSI